MTHNKNVIIILVSPYSSGGIRFFKNFWQLQKIICCMHGTHIKFITNLVWERDIKGLNLSSLEGFEMQRYNYSVVVKTDLFKEWY